MKIMAYASRPVPQNIMSVEFKLFDFMTLKQFMISFGLLLLSFILFFLLPAPWKILVPLIIVILGGIIIFVPFNGEPFQEFVGSFLEAMISPQRRIWNKKGVIVQSAYTAAKKYQFGNDPKDTQNDFRFNEAQTVKVPSEQKELDNEESKFLEQNGQDGNAAYAPPQKKIEPTNYVRQQAGTNVSPKAVQANINLDQFSDVNNQNTSPAEQLQNIPSQPEASQNDINIKIEEPPQVATVQNQDKHEEISINIAPKANIPQIEQNPEQPKPSKVEEIQSKNYIFGNVEGKDGEGVLGAFITVFQKETELETLFTNAGGDFQTIYEYPSGEYTIDVQVAGKPFNKIVFHHDPIDPNPIIIVPKFDPEADVKKEEVESIGPEFKEDGVFVGSYDNNTFDLGQDYRDLEEAENNFPQLQILKSEDELNIQNNTPAQTGFLARESQLPKEPQTFEIPKEEPNYPPDFESNIIKSAESSYQNNQNLENLDQIYQEEISKVPENILHPAFTKVITEIDFKILPDADVQMDPSLTNIPNTVNGIVMDASNTPVPSVLINITDTNGQIIRTLATDPNGRFYSYSPFTLGKYHIEFVRQGFLFTKYYIDLQGHLVNPKIVQPIENVS